MRSGRTGLRLGANNPRLRCQTVELELIRQHPSRAGAAPQRALVLPQLPNLPLHARELPVGGPQRSQVDGMNCIQPTAPAELGPMLRPKFDSTLLIAASTCQRIP